MAKNMTRKGLALGAAFALVGSALVATPAQAAGELNLQPKTGTTYGSIIGETFTLSVNTNPGYASTEFAGTKLKYNVTNPSKGALTITAGGAAGAGVVNAGAADNSNYVVTAQAPSAVAANDIAILTAATATSSVSVQAWVDSNFNSVIDAGEWTSAVQTVVFNKASEVTFTTEFTAPVIGDTKFLAYVSASPSINMSQIADANLGVRFGKNATDAGEQFTGKAAATFDAATGKLKFNPTVALVADAALATPVAIANNAAAVAGGFRYDAQAAWKVSGLGTLATLVAEANLVGTQVAYAVAAATVAGIAVPATTDSDNSSQTGAAVTVRSTATTVPVSILVTKTGAVALPDTKVTVYVAEAAVGGTDTSATVAVGNYDTSSFTAGGKTLTDTSATAQVISFEATTDAKGKVVFDLTASAKAGDAVVVWASAQGVNVNAAAAGAVSTAANKATYTWTTAAPASLKNNNTVGTGAVLKQAAGSTFSLNYTVLDQFGAAIPTADKYRVVITQGANNFYPVVVGGKAAQSVTLASTATGTLSYTALVQTKGTDGNYAGTTPTHAGVSVVVGSSYPATGFTALADLAADGTVTDVLSTSATNTIVVAGTRTGAADTVEFAAGDTDAGATNSVDATVTTGFSVKGQVTDATTAGTYSTVTLSGANLNFVVGGTHYASGSVTVQTDASGNYDGVRVLSNKTGKQTLTITAGSVSKSYVIDFLSAAVAAGKTLTITAPDSVLPGSTLAITAKLVDAFGNPVAGGTGASTFAYTYTGPGIQVGTAPTAFSASTGEAKIGALLGGNDTGSVVVTFTYDADGAGTTYAAITSTKTILIGTSEVNQGVLAVWTKNLGDGTAKMYAKNVLGQGKVQFMLNGKEIAWTNATTLEDYEGGKLRVVGSSNYLVRTVDLKDGKNVLEIYVDGYRMKRVVYSN